MSFSLRIKSRSRSLDPSESRSCFWSRSNSSSLRSTDAFFTYSSRCVISCARCCCISCATAKRKPTCVCCSVVCSTVLYFVIHQTTVFDYYCPTHISLSNLAPSVIRRGGPTIQKITRKNWLPLKELQSGQDLNLTYSLYLTIKIQNKTAHTLFNHCLHWCAFLFVNRLRRRRILLTYNLKLNLDKNWSSTLTLYKHSLCILYCYDVNLLRKANSIKSFISWLHNKLPLQSLSAQSIKIIKFEWKQLLFIVILLCSILLFIFYMHTYILHTNFIISLVFISFLYSNGSSFIILLSYKVILPSFFSSCP